MHLTHCRRGNYQFLTGIAPYSSGVVADSGWEIVHVNLVAAIPWRDGLTKVRQYLEHQGRDRHALCAVELRCPAPHSMDSFIAFNRDYRLLLEEWDMLEGDANPIARTNVAPAVDPPSESMVHGFSYTARSDVNRPTFVVAGGGELRGNLDTQNIVRAGETSAEAMLEKTRCVVEIMQERLAGLGSDSFLSQINVYTIHDWKRELGELLIPGLPATARLGVHWHYTRPPVEDIEFEMDMRGVVTDLVVDLR